MNRLVTRSILATIALLLAMLGWCSFWLAGRARVWVEIGMPPGTVCYQGPPLEELLNVRLWPHGPGIKLIQERRLGLIRLPASPQPPDARSGKE